MLYISIATAALIAGVVILPSAAQAATAVTVRVTEMRAGPDSEYPTVRDIRSGDRVEIHGCLSDWTWCDAGYGTERGWVAGNALVVDYDGRRQAIVQIAPQIGIGVLSFSFGSYWDNHYRGRPFYTERSRWERHYNDRYQSHWGPRASSGFTVGSARMRAGPDYDYPVVQIIRSNRRVDIYGCLNDWSWCDVGYRSERGWIEGDMLAVDYQNRRRAIIGIGPTIGIGVLSFSFGSYWDNYYRGRPFYGERSRWERHYFDNYKAHWGPRPDRRDDDGRDRNKQDRHDSDRGATDRGQHDNTRTRDTQPGKTVAPPVPTQPHTATPPPREDAGPRPAKPQEPRDSDRQRVTPKPQPHPAVPEHDAGRRDGKAPGVTEPARHRENEGQQVTPRPSPQSKAPHETDKARSPVPPAIERHDAKPQRPEPQKEQDRPAKPKKTPDDADKERERPGH